MKPINNLCEKNAELHIVKAVGTYTYHWALEISTGKPHHTPEIVSSSLN
jgi:hypothetical protein